MIVHGLASLIAISNGSRYISRIVRSSTLELMNSRLVSCSLAMKCFIDVPTPVLWTPWMKEVAMTPVK